MFSKVVSLVTLFGIALASLEPVHHAPQPYKFGYNVKDKHGEQYREEEGNGAGGVKGSYGFTDERGIKRHVEYVADKAGFRAQVKTNEPGTANQDPAAVKMISDAPYAGGAAIDRGYGGYAVNNLNDGYQGGNGYGFNDGNLGNLGYGGYGLDGNLRGFGYGSNGLGNGYLRGLGYGRYGNIGSYGGLGNGYLRGLGYGGYGNIGSYGGLGYGRLGLGRLGGLGFGLGGAFGRLGYSRYGF